MSEEPRDSVDEHVARWAAFWKDEPDFAPEVEGALVRMNYIARELRREDAAAFAGKDLSLEDYKTLHALMIQPWPVEATPAQLADTLNVTRAAITSRVDRLATAQLVTRQVDESDRRRVLVKPTASGRAAWSRYIFEGMARDQRILSALDTAELKQLNALLRKVVRSRES